jgi:hypothetical protein
MSSTLTGNYDVCIEITEAVMSALAVPALGGGATQIFGFKQVFAGQTIIGQANLLIDSGSVTVDPAHSPHGLVTVNFGDSAFSVTAPVAARAAPLAGSLVASVPFKLSAPSGGKSNLQLDFTDPSVTVNVTLDAASQARIEAVLARFGVPAASASTILNQLMKAALLSAKGTLDLPGASFAFVPGQDGTLSPMKFADMALLTRPPGAGGQPGVLCVLGTILTSHIPLESVANKTATATDGSHQVSVTLSPEAFRDLIFCPSIGQSAGITNISKLCPTCGSAASVSISGIDLTTVSATLQEGQIAIHGAANASETGWSANVSFDAHTTLNLVGGIITPTSVVDNVTEDVSLDWWVWLLSGLTLGAIGLIADAAVTTVANSVVSSLAKDELSKILSNNSGTPLVGISTAVTLNSVATHAQGIVLQGLWAIPPQTAVTSVRGMVTDPDEAPIEDATVSVGSIQLSTDSNGLYKVVVAPGNYEINVIQDGFVPSAKISVTVPAGKTVTEDFALERTKPFTITGHVKDTKSAPIDGATVTIVGDAPIPEQLNAKTDSAGLYSIIMDPGPFAGSYTVSAGADGFLPSSVNIPAIPNGATISQDFILGATHSFNIVGQVQGESDDGKTGPINNASILVESSNESSGVGAVPPNQNYSAKTGADGNYSITVNPGQYSGAYTVSAGAAGFGGDTALSVEQPNGTTVTVNFILPPFNSPTPPPHGGGRGGGRPQ